MAKEDDETAVYYCGDEAGHCLTLLEEIGKAVDQYSDHWLPEELLPLEYVHKQLKEALAMLKTHGMYPPPPYRRA